VYANVSGVVNQLVSHMVSIRCSQITQIPAEG